MFHAVRILYRQFPCFRVVDPHRPLSVGILDMDALTVDTQRFVVIHDLLPVVALISHVGWVSQRIIYGLGVLFAREEHTVLPSVNSLREVPDRLGGFRRRR
jgi:hypothetical protein